MYFELEQLTKKFGDKTVVNNLTLSIKKGEMLCLLGPSGCGKTTTLKMIGGFLKQNNGVIKIEDQDITAMSPETRPVSTVFQSYALFPHLSVLENVIYGLKFQGLNKKEAIKRGEEYLEKVSLSSYRNSKIHEISGGQQQRVALVRALIVNPKVLLLDEPLSNLDAELRIKMREEIKSLQKQLNMTMIFVTHDQEEAMVLADKIAIMNNGNLIQLDSPERIYNKPKDLFALNFLGGSNAFEDKDGKKFYVRPENITIDDFGDIEGTILERTFLGFYDSYRVLHQGNIIRVNVPWGKDKFEVNQMVKMKFLNKIYL